MAMRRHVALVLAAGCTVAGAVALIPAQRTLAYMLMGSPWPRNQVNQLVVSEWGQHYTDNSAWMEDAMTNGIQAWNSTPTPVRIQGEFYQDTTQIEFYTESADSTNDGHSSGGCQALNNNSQCVWALVTLVENCYWYTSNTQHCGMQPGTPTYDQETTAHELGHALGLAHSCTRNALMSGPNSQCSNGGAPYSCYGESDCISTPQQDDINGINAMYGGNSYQSGGGGCADVAPLPTPGVHIDSVPIIATPSPMPGEQLAGSAEQEAFGAAANPVGAGETAANDASAATAKVVPWSSLPGPGSTTVPFVGTINRPC
jgi:hypothetical protein